MVDKDLITVVVPVYNVEKYIKKCIDSIINQTYKNIEIILVNDGSTDNSGKICNDYAKKDCRIKVIHKENGGLSDARNFGIENTTGKYITFVDSDDYIEIDYVEYLYNLVVKNKVDISICSMFIDSTKKHINQGKKFKDNIFDTKKCYEYMLLEKGFTISAPAKLYLSELFRDIKYPTGMLCEDNGTTYKLIAKCDRIAYGCQSKYHYVAREDSIMRSTFNPKKNATIKNGANQNDSPFQEIQANINVNEIKDGLNAKDANNEKMDNHCSLSVADVGNGTGRDGGSKSHQG